MEKLLETVGEVLRAYDPTVVLVTEAERLS
jgi:hypothetical protein